MLSHLLILGSLAFGFAYRDVGTFPSVQLFANSDNTVNLMNGYVNMLVSLTDNSILSILSDYSGSGQFDLSKNVLSGPVISDIKIEACQISVGVKSFDVLTNNEDSVTIRLSSEYGCRNSSLITETWEITLNRAYRGFKIFINGFTLEDINNLNYISHGIYSQSSSVYGLYDRGVVQMMNYVDHCLPSTDELNRLYFLGNGTALDVLISSTITHSNNDANITNPIRSMIMTNHESIASGFQSIIIGKGSSSKDMNLGWKSCKKVFTSFEKQTVNKDTKWSISLELIPNNYNFPALSVVDVVKQTELFSITDLTTYLTGIYASPAGCLKSYYELWDGTIAPTIAHPDTGYSPDTNFFDPDNFISLSALLCKYFVSCLT